MKLSRTALKELTKRYKDVLLKCAYLNAIALAVMCPVHASAATVENPVDSTALLEALSDGNRVTLNNAATYLIEGSSTLYFGPWTSSTVDGNGGILNIVSGDVSILNSQVTNFRDSIVLGDGGAIYNAGSLQIYQGLFQSNQANNGGAIYNTGNLTFKDESQFGTKYESSTNKATNGGAIYNVGTMNFMNIASFSSNTASDNGGTIYNAGGVVQDAVVSSYGMIFNDATTEKTGVVFLSTSTSEKDATNGGAIYNTGTIKFDSKVSFGSVAENVTRGKRVTGNGGAVYNAQGAVIDFLNDVSFIGNGYYYTADATPVLTVITQKGGAVYNEGILNFNNVSFGDKSDAGAGNQVTGSGGAIYNTSSGVLNVTGTSLFSGNISKATGSDTGGGAIYNQGTATVNNAEFLNNHASKWGGALHAASGSQTTFTGSSVTVNDQTIEGGYTKFSGNQALYGGAIYTKGSINFNAGQTIFENNKATNGGGGAIEVNGTAVLNFLNSVSFVGNTATGNGGAINNTSGKINFTNASFSTNQTAGGGGGALYLGVSSGTKSETTFLGDTTTFSSNIAKFGGAIYTQGNVNFNATQTTFENNKATSGGGGAFEIDGGALVSFLHSVSFAGNTTTENGGAIKVKNGTLSIKGNALFSENISTGSSAGGGAIYNQGTATVNNAEFLNNQASKWGGALHAASGSQTTFTGSSVTVNDQTIEGGYTKFSGNQALYGGAIYTKGLIDFNAGQTIFENNKATNGGGGAIEANSGAVITFLNSASFVGNTATGNGGAISNASGIISFKGGVSFSGNMANGQKNDIYMSGGNVVLNFGDAESTAVQTTADELITEGGISGSGIINKYSAGSLFLSSKDYFNANLTQTALLGVSHSNNAGYTGTFNQYNGTTYANSTQFFKGTNNIYGGQLVTKGEKLNYYAAVSKNGSLTHTAVETNTGYNIVNANALELYGDSDALSSASITFVNGNYQMFSDMGTGTSEDIISFQNATVQVKGRSDYGTSYLGETYQFDANSIIEARTDENAIEDIKFQNMSGSGAVFAFDVLMQENNGTISFLSDTLTSDTSYTFTLNPELINYGFDLGLLADGGTYQIDVLKGNAQFISAPDFAFTNGFQYNIDLSDNGQSIILKNIIRASDDLYAVNVFDGNSSFIPSSSQTYVMENGDLGVTGYGQKIISGEAPTDSSTTPVSIINANTYNMFNLVQDTSGENQTTTLLVKDLRIEDAALVLSSEQGSGSAEFNNVIINNSGDDNNVAIQNGAILSLTNVSVTGTKGEIVNTGRLTSNNSSLLGVRNNSSLLVTGGSIETLENNAGSNSLATLNGTDLNTLTVNGGTVDLKANASDKVIISGNTTNAGVVKADGVTFDSVNNSGSLTATNNVSMKSVVNSGELTVTGGSIETLENNAGSNSLATLNGTDLNTLTVNGGTVDLKANASDKVIISGNTTNAGVVKADGVTFDSVSNSGSLTATNNVSMKSVVNSGELTVTGGSIETLENNAGSNSLATLNGTDIQKTLNIISGEVTLLSNVVGDELVVSGVTTVSDVLNIQGSEAVQLNGVTGTGIINNVGKLNLIKGTTAKNNTFSGQFIQTEGTTIASSEDFFQGGSSNNIIKGGTLETSGSLLGYGATATSNGTIRHTASGTQQQNANNLVVSSAENGNATIEFVRGNYAMADMGGDVNNNANDMVRIDNGTVKLTGSAYEGETYSFVNNSTISLQENQNRYNNVTIQNASGSAIGKFDLGLTVGPSGTGIVAQSDKLTVVNATDDSFKITGIHFNLVVDSKVADSGLNKEYTVQVLGGEAEFDNIPSTDLASYIAQTNAYSYVTQIVENETDSLLQSVKFKAVGLTDDKTLSHINQYNGNSAFYMDVASGNTSGVVEYTVGAGLGKTGEGAKNIYGKSTDATQSVINAAGYDLFDVQSSLTKLTVQDLTIQDAGSVLKTALGSGETIFNNVIINNSADKAIENASQLTLTNVQITGTGGSISNDGTLMVNGESSLKTVNNNAQLQMTGGMVSSVENKNANATALFSGTDASSLTEVQTMNNTLGQVSFNSYSTVQTLNNSGTAFLNDDSEADIVNNDNVLTAGKMVINTLNNNSLGEAVLTQTTVTESVSNKGKLTFTNVSAQGLILNEKELTLVDMETAATIENKLGASLQVKGDVSLTGNVTNNADMTVEEGSVLSLTQSLAGNGILYMNGSTLDAPPSFKTENNVVSHNMILGDSVQEISMADFEVSSNSQFDLGTVQMTLKQLSLGEGSTISVTLNGLSEHAVVKGQQINSADAAVLDLNLGDNFEAGLYQIFYMNEIMSLPQVNYNGDDYQILDMKDGRYSFISTNSNEVASTFGSDENETKAILALHKGTSENQEFNKMQAELIDYLQSDNKEAKQKAVESVNAVGGDIKPIIQTVSFEHFNSISNAVQTQSVKAMNIKTGRAGGDEAPRSVVWGKAFYSHTKNSSNGNYKMNGTGGILALQTQVTDSLILGAGYSYSHADVKQTFRDTIAQNNAGFIYLKYQPSNWFVDGIASYMRGQYEEDKYILSTSASANYNVDVLGLQGILGYDYTYKNLVLTPKVGLSYMRLNQEAYTDSLGTTVGNLSSDYMTVMFGLDIDAPIKTVKGFKVRPIAGVMFGYDIMTDDMSVTNTLSNGAVYVTKADGLSRFNTRVHAGVQSQLNENTTLELEYIGSFRRSYQDHGGMLKFKYHF